MKLPDPQIIIGPQTSSLGTTGLTGIVLMTLHVTGHLTGWAWPILYIFLILSGIGQENRKPRNK
jgi:hypothetical protein